jgi:SAM-dependent methyltransferase
VSAGDSRLYAPATERNRAPILAVLEPLLHEGSVLEVASGTGEHITWFATQMPALRFLPSDPDPAHRASIAQWTQALGVTNVAPPLDLDATATAWTLPAAELARLRAVLCINMIHIAPWQATQGLMRNAAAVLPPGGVLYLYGPFRRGGNHTAPSNAAFHESLRARDAAWGVRDLEAVQAQALAHGLTTEQVTEMPANNLSLVLRRTGAP